MPALKNTKTWENLKDAFAGESQARNRYTFFASVAKKEGFEQISALFLETADNEKEHAKVFFKYLEGGDTEITASYPAGRIGTTAENLLAAAEGEHPGLGLHPVPDDLHVDGAFGDELAHGSWIAAPAAARACNPARKRAAAASVPACNSG